MNFSLLPFCEFWFPVASSNIIQSVWNSLVKLYLIDLIKNIYLILLCYYNRQLCLRTNHPEFALFPAENFTKSLTEINLL